MKHLLAIVATLIIISLQPSETHAQYLLDQGIYDAATGLLSASGTWTQVDGSALTYAGTLLFATGSGGADTLSFYCFCNSVVIWISKASTGATDSDFCFDGDCFSQSFFNATTVNQFATSWAIGGNPASHLIEIKTINGESGNVWIDAILIDWEPLLHATPDPTITPQPTSTPAPTATPQPSSTPAPTATPQPSSTPQPTATPFTGIGGGDPAPYIQWTIEYGATPQSQDVRFTYAIDAGQLVQTQLLMGIFVVWLLILCVWIWRAYRDEKR